jgi:hypothetical protein
MKRRAYRATEVKHVLLEGVLRSAPPGAVTAGLDIGKREIRAVIRWEDGSFERPWKAENPSEIGTLVGLLRNVQDHRALMVAMESTGTYGDALRAKLDQAGLEVRRVGGKAAHDYAEVFDGVPSQHDGKDAAVIAERAAQSAFVKPWFEAKKAKDKERGNGALIAVARKLALALHAVGAHGKPFEPWRLFSQEALVRKERRFEFRGAVAAPLGKISDVANSMVACGPYIPGRRSELPEGQLPAPRLDREHNLATINLQPRP